MTIHDKKLTDLNKKKTIRKILVLGAWLLVISGIITLLLAANSKKKVHVCRDVLIGIKGNEGKFYVEKEDVLKLMEKTMGGSLPDRATATINLAKLEIGLKTNPWVKSAELYFDSKDALHVFVEEREPVARVFTMEGNSFYMDSSGAKMPLLDKMSIRVPVITGFPNVRKFNSVDSSWLQQVKHVAQFIYSNEFWNAQVGQIDITPDRKFELIPVIGNHVIRLGDGNNIEEKLNRLYVFYKQVMSKVGFDRYAALDLEFNGQVVAVKKDTASFIDSVQLQKNIQELMNRANMQNINEDMLPAATIAGRTDSTVSPAAQNNSVSTKTDPNPVTVLNSPIQNTAKKKTETKSAPKKSATSENQKQPVKSIGVKQSDVKPNKAKPKAVMPKPNGN